nr:hypothetical protein [Tanacetum cinerariifolium]
KLQIELTLEQSQQGVSNDVLGRIKRVEELKRNKILRCEMETCQGDSLNPPNHRSDIGTRNTTYFNDLLLEISQIDISVDEDMCTWVLSNDGTLSVKNARRLIDSKLLPFIPTPSMWDKFLPRKVNIFLWRLSLDRLPHRLNLSSHGLDIPTISYSSCNGNVASAYHVFFECDLVKEI